MCSPIHAARADGSHHHSAPAYVDHADPASGVIWRFHRTEIEGPEHVTNGKAWIQTFEHVLRNLPRPRRTLGVSLSDSGDPRYSMPAFGVKQRNDATKAMREPDTTPGLPDGARHGVGVVVKLPSGHQVLITCNVGPEAPVELPRKFREMPLEELTFLAVDSRCPHMQACLNEGEVKDVEDLAVPGVVPRRRAIIRCPWHNMQFDLQTGEGVGNHLQLETYPVRVAYGALYVGVRLTAANGEGTGQPQHVPCDPLAAMQVDDEGDTAGSCCSGGDRAAMAAMGQLVMTGRSRSPARPLRQHNTVL